MNIYKILALVASISSAKPTAMENELKLQIFNFERKLYEEHTYSKMNHKNLL